MLREEGSFIVYPPAHVARPFSPVALQLMSKPFISRLEHFEATVESTNIRFQVSKNVFPNIVSALLLC